MQQSSVEQQEGGRCEVVFERPPPRDQPTKGHGCSDETLHHLKQMGFFSSMRVPSLLSRALDIICTNISYKIH